MSLDQVNPNLDFWSDALDMGWGARLLDVTTSGLWSPEEAELSINASELLVVERGLLHFAHLVFNSAVAISVQAGGTRSPILSAIAQRILRRAETVNLVLAPQFMWGKNNCPNGFLASTEPGPGVRMDSQVGGISGVEQEVADDDIPFCLLVESPLFTIFSPFHDPSSIGMDALLQNWDGYQVYAFPPWSMILLVLKKLRSSSGVLMTLVAPF